MTARAPITIEPSSAGEEPAPHQEGPPGERGASRRGDLITARGKTLTICQWAREVGTYPQRIRTRIKVLGWDPERAIFGAAARTRIAEEKIAALRARVAAGESLAVVAKELGIRPEYARDIVAGLARKRDLTRERS